VVHTSAELAERARGGDFERGGDTARDVDDEHGGYMGQAVSAVHRENVG